MIVTGGTSPFVVPQRKERMCLQLLCAVSGKSSSSSWSASNCVMRLRHRRKMSVGVRSSCAITALSIKGGRIMNGACVKDVRPFDGADEAATSSGERRVLMDVRFGVLMVNALVRESESMIMGCAMHSNPSSATSVVIGRSLVPLS